MATVEFDPCFIPKPNLQTMALVKIAASMWNHYNTRYEIMSLPLHSLSDGIVKWIKIEENVIKKTKELPLPKVMRMKICQIIKPVGLQMKKWIEEHCIDRSHGTYLPNEFFYTSEGTINEVKTATTIVKDEYVNVMKRYKLACHFCLENDILELWHRMPEDARESFLNEKDLLRFALNPLVVYWSYYMKDKLNELENIIERLYNRRYSAVEYAFEMAVLNCNKAGTDYLLQKLDIETKELIIIKTAKTLLNALSFSYDYGDILSVLFANLSKEKIIEVVQTGPLNVLFCFLEWPWQNLFLKTVSCLDKSMRIKYFEQVHCAINYKIHHDYYDYDYKSLWERFIA